MSEKRIMHGAMIALTKHLCKVFRNTVGLAYQGKAQRFTHPGIVEVEQGDILIRKARTVRAGLITGSSDIIGWHTRVITEYDLGRSVAIFVACETKDDDGQLEPEQKHFLQVVKDSGGIAIVARSAEEAAQAVQNGGNFDQHNQG